MIHFAETTEGESKMDPKQLAEKFARIDAASAAKVTELERQREVDAAREKAELDAFADKVTKIVLPFLEETKDAYRQNSFDYKALRNPNGTIVGVRITIKGFQPAEIRQGKRGIVELRRLRPETSSATLKRVGTYGAKKKPFIGTLDDLTREKVGDLIDVMTDDDNRS
jgi:hypothetical protein